jgi:hypothetical protein
MRSSVYIAGLALFASRLLAQEIAVDHVVRTLIFVSSHTAGSRTEPGFCSTRRLGTEARFSHTRTMRSRRRDGLRQLSMST